MPEVKPRMLVALLSVLAAVGLVIAGVRYLNAGWGRDLPNNPIPNGSASNGLKTGRLMPNGFATSQRAPSDPTAAQQTFSGRVPSDRMQVRLIKNALLSLNNANMTGNYSVLRELCSPELRQRKKASDFALAFRNSNARNRDMSLVMELKPNQSRPPAMSADGRMRLVGYFPTQPLVLHYDLVFLNTQRGDWWIDGIVVRTKPAQAKASPAPEPRADRSSRFSPRPTPIRAATNYTGHRQPLRR